MDMISNCTKDACNGFHKSAMKKQFYDKYPVLAQVKTYKFMKISSLIIINKLITMF